MNRKGGLGLILIILVIVLIIGLGIGGYFLMNSSNEIETLTLSIETSDEISAETSVIERNNNLKEAKIDTTIDFGEDISSILAQTATLSCYLFQENFFGDEGIKFDYSPSKEEKEYLSKMNEFLEGYDLTQVIVRVNTINGKEGFDCVLRGNDDTQNTLVLISEDGLRFTLGLDQANEEYFGSGNEQNIDDCNQETDETAKDWCFYNLAKSEKK